MLCAFTIAATVAPTAISKVPMSADIPDGFRPLKFAIGFIEAIGPLYGKWDAGKPVMGFRVEMRHCNPGKVAHGGMLASFADMFIPIGARLQGKADVGFAPTVSLNLDYIAPAPLGSWVEGRAEFLRAGKSLFFAQGLATADGTLCLRASAVFKVTPPMGGVPTMEAMFGDV
jgi:acyl-coenzyme A thioesterase PaaI-like protein